MPVPWLAQNGPTGTSAAKRIATAQSARDVSSRRQMRWQDARLIEIIEEMSDAVTLRLRLEESANFLPGQYYNVRLSVLGRAGPLRSSISVCARCPAVEYHRILFEVSALVIGSKCGAQPGVLRGRAMTAGRFV